MIRRLMIGVAALAALAGCSTGDSTNAVAAISPTPTSSSRTVELKATEYTLSPDALTLKPGTYTFTLRNVGQFPHDLHVAATADGTEVGGSTVITTNQTTSFTVTLRPGEYTLWCAVNAHRSLGMHGKLTVR